MRTRSDGQIDYSRYTRAQLEEARQNVDPTLYPLNHANLLRELAGRADERADPSSLLGRFQTLEGLYSRSPQEWVAPICATLMVIAVAIAQVELLLVDTASIGTLVVGGVCVVVLAAIAVQLVDHTAHAYEFVDGRIRCWRYGTTLAWDRPLQAVFRVTRGRDRLFETLNVEWPDWCETLYIPRSMARRLAHAR